MADLRKEFTRAPSTLDQWPTCLRWRVRRELARVALFHPDAAAHSTAILIFVVEEGAMPAPRGEGTGMVFGRPEPGGAFVLVHEGRSIWPSRPPGRPWLATMRR